MLDVLIFASTVAVTSMVGDIAGSAVKDTLGIGRANAAEMPRAECQTRVHQIHHARTYWQREIAVYGCTIHVVQLSMGRGEWAQVQGVIHAVERNVTPYAIERLAVSTLELSAKRGTRVTLKWDVATGVWITGIGKNIVETPVDALPSPPVPRPETSGDAAKRILQDSVAPPAPKPAASRETPDARGGGPSWLVPVLSACAMLSTVAIALGEAARRAKQPAIGHVARGMLASSALGGTVAALWGVAHSHGVTLSVSVGGFG